MLTKLFKRNSFRKFSTKSTEQSPKGNREAFLVKIEEIKKRNQEILQNSSEDSLTFCKIAKQGIDSLSLDERKYFMFRVLHEDSMYDVQDFRDGVSAYTNPFDENQNSISFGSLASSKTGVTESAKTVDTQEKKEEVKEVQKKTVMDVEYCGVDPTKKMIAIKEIKAIMNRGLKEAKDIVESTSFVLKAGMKTEEAEELAKKLTDFGCVIKLK